MKKHKLLWIGIGALTLCIASAIFAESVAVTDVAGRPNWDNFGIAIWVTALVTIPTFGIFLVVTIAAMIKWLRRKRK